MRNLFFRIALILGLLAPANSLRAVTLTEMQEWHLRAEQGGIAEADQAVEKFTALIAENPENQLARVYLGSSQTLRSRSLGIGMEKLRALQAGGKLMDAAVDAAPKDPRVRLIRAINYLKLPTLFGKRAAAHADFDLLLASAGAGDRLLTDDERGAIFLFAGQSLSQRNRNDEARQAWEKGILLARNTTLLGSLQREIARAQ